MTTLEKVCERAETIAIFYEDHPVKVKNIRFQSIEMLEILGEPHYLRPVAQQSIANRLGIPIQYLRKCPQEIQKLNLNYWIEKERNEELFLRFDRTEIRAIFTHRYIPTDNREVLERLRKLDYPLDTRVQCSLDGEFMMLNIPDGRETFAVNGTITGLKM